MDEVLYFDEDATSIEIGSEAIPEQVIEVAKTLAEGEGRYLDEHGGLVEPF